MYIELSVIMSPSSFFTLSMYNDTIRVRKAKEDKAMKTIIREDLNLYIEKEMVEGRRFEYLVRAYKVVDGEITGFLGKYFVPTNFTDDEIVELYHDPMVEE